MNEKRWKSGKKFVVVDLDRCMGAGNCEQVCPADVYKVINGQVDASNIGECIACGACETACLSAVIKSHHAW